MSDEDEKQDENAAASEESVAQAGEPVADGGGKRPAPLAGLLALLSGLPTRLVALLARRRAAQDPDGEGIEEPGGQEPDGQESAQSSGGLLGRLKPRSRRELVWTGAGTFLALTVGLVVSGVVSPHEESQEQDPLDFTVAEQVEDEHQEVRDELDPQELLKLARGALLDGDLEHAASFADDGLARTDPGDDALRSGFFRLLARVSHARGEGLKERIFLQNADRLRVRAGQALALLDRAQVAYHEQRFPESRQLCAQFLLRQGELAAAEREKYAPVATMLMGKAAFSEWATGVTGALDIVARPGFDFEGDL